jgi:hypothetical protein
VSQESLSYQPKRESELRRRYERDGFVVVPDLLPRQLIEDLRLHTEELLAPHDQPMVQTAYDAQGAPKLVKASGLAERDPRFEQLASFAPLVDVVEVLLGPGARRFRDVLVVKPARTGGSFSYHQDSAYWDVEPKQLVSAWVALGDVSAEASCLRVVPRTHGELIEHGLFLRGKVALPKPIVRGLRKLVSLAGTGDNPQKSGGNMTIWRLKQLVLARATRFVPALFDLQDYRLAPDLTEHCEEQSLPVRAGDVIFFHSLLWHASGPNRSEQSRYAEIVSFMSAEARYVGRGATHFPLARAQ